ARLDRPVVHTVRVDHLRVLRRGLHAPNDVSFTLRAKHIVRLNSASGTGKSTIIAALLGFLRPDDGVITVDGRDLSTMDLTAWRRSIAWVPQQPRFAAETVAEELHAALADDLRPVTGEELFAVAQDVAAHHLLHRRIVELSTGERQ